VDLYPRAGKRGKKAEREKRLRHNSKVTQTDDMREADI
jgi:hypothetical protein